MPEIEPNGEALVEMLAAEARALASGDFAALGELAHRRDAAMATLDKGADLALVRQMASRNLRLAEAAIAGVQAARARLVQALNGASFDTYARDGQRHQFLDSRPSVQRRA